MHAKKIVFLGNFFIHWVDNFKDELYFFAGFCITQ